MVSDVSLSLSINSSTMPSYIKKHICSNAEAMG